MAFFLFDVLPNIVPTFYFVIHNEFGKRIPIV